MELNVNYGTHFKELNEKIKSCPDESIVINGCIGQRYVGTGAQGKKIVINGTPGNALGAYLNGSVITVNGNAQDAVGDTMNDGAIFVSGNSGDATGYAMRGGTIMVKGNAGYRAGIHMKSYKEKSPVIVIGGCAGAFLGEYQAGGTIIVLNLNNRECAAGNYIGTGMHGGKIFIRSALPVGLPPQVKAEKATDADIEEIKAVIDTFCSAFKVEFVLDKKDFFVLTPNTANPYKRLYINN